MKNKSKRIREFSSLPPSLQKKLLDTRTVIETMNGNSNSEVRALQWIKSKKPKTYYSWKSQQWELYKKIDRIRIKHGLSPIHSIFS